MIFSCSSVFSSDVGGVKITRINMYELPLPAGGIFISFSGGSKADDKCPGSDAQYFVDLNDQPKAALLYAHAMTALTHQLTVNINGSDECAGHAQVETIKDLQVYSN